MGGTSNLAQPTVNLTSVPTKLVEDSDKSSSDVQEETDEEEYRKKLKQKKRNKLIRLKMTPINKEINIAENRRGVDFNS